MAGSQCRRKAVAEGDGLPLALDDPHGEQFVLGPGGEERLDAGGGRGFGGLLSVDLFGAGDDDALLAAKEVGEDGLDVHGGVAELAAFAGGGAVAELGELAGLVVVVGGEQLVRGEAAFV
ncbi:hypothetical protein ACFCXK_31730 [Streptomyces sp. NPDC056269]|uniref:hypothetical protein n=1 Tax=Streptomyces sp. NPDC056269 TaxID=3345768 RepID=UPI0035E3B742